jgi:excisionase family DNA binding protein
MKTTGTRGIKFSADVITTDTPRRYLRIGEAAIFCGVGHRVVRDWIRQHLLPVYVVGHRSRVLKVEDVEACMARFRRTSAGGDAS